MKTLIINLLFKFVDFDCIASIAAKCIVFLLEYARSKSDAHWDRAKGVVKQINNWSNLFMEVYDDDALTEAEEEKIAEAIRNCTSKEKIEEILEKIKKSKRGRKPKKTNKQKA